MLKKYDRWWLTFLGVLCIVGATYMILTPVSIWERVAGIIILVVWSGTILMIWLETRIYR